MDKNIPIGAMVDAEIRQNHFNEVRGSSEGVLKKKHDDLERDMHQAVEQAGDDLDLTKADVLAGTTQTEKAASLVKIHSQLAATVDALREAGEMKAIAESIRAGTPAHELHAPTDHAGNPLAPSPLAVTIAQGNPYSFAEGIREQLGGEPFGRDFVQASRGREFSFDLGKPEVRATLFKTDDGWPPFVRRMPGYVPDAQRPVQVTDLLPQVTTDQHAIKYMEETVFMNAAAEVNEGAAAPEAELELTERTVPIEKIAVHIPVTEEQLEDVQQAEMYLTNRLPFMVRQRLDAQILNGSGVAPNLKGILQNAGIQNETQAYANDLPTKPLNALLKAKTKVNYGAYAMANAFVINPNYWDNIALAETASAGFYLGNPQNAFEPRIWGLPATMANVLADGNADDEIPALVGDFMNFVYLAMRRNLTLEFGYINDDFTKGQTRIKATCRTAVVTTRPAAFCKVTIDAA